MARSLSMLGLVMFSMGVLSLAALAGNRRVSLEMPQKALDQDAPASNWLALAYRTPFSLN